MNASVSFPENAPSNLRKTKGKHSASSALLPTRMFHYARSQGAMSKCCRNRMRRMASAQGSTIRNQTGRSQAQPLASILPVARGAQQARAVHQYFQKSGMLCLSRRDRTPEALCFALNRPALLDALQARTTKPAPPQRPTRRHAGTECGAYRLIF